MSADRRSKLGVCTPSQPRHPLPPPSALWGLWTGRIKSDWEQFGLIPPPLRCFPPPPNALKKNLIDTIGSDWASLLIFSSLFLGSPVQGKKKKKEKSCVKERGKEEKKKKIPHYRKLIHKTTPLFFSDKTSVAKGQGDLHGEASKEKDTGWKWKDMRSTPLCHSPPSKRSIDFHKKDGMQFLSGEYSQTI